MWVDGEVACRYLAQDWMDRLFHLAQGKFFRRRRRERPAPQSLCARIAASANKDRKSAASQRPRRLAAAIDELGIAQRLDPTALRTQERRACRILGRRGLEPPDSISEIDPASQADLDEILQVAMDRRAIHRAIGAKLITDLGVRNRARRAAEQSKHPDARRSRTQAAIPHECPQLVVVVACARHRRDVSRMYTCER